MGLAGCNVLSIGMFAWSALEPSEGPFRFGWLDRVMDDLASHGLFAALATPNGARRPGCRSVSRGPARRPRRWRNLHGLRHNHCYTSPVYREKTRAIDRRLAERYKSHPALLLWHVSNEYGGECHCGLCQEAFRAWLARYADDLDRLNRAWWTPFWSHTFNDWSNWSLLAPTASHAFRA